MGIVIGIDVGISTTKIVGIKNNKISAPIRITAADPITSLYGAFGKYLHDNNIELKDVEHVMLTGLGAAYIDQPIYGLPTSKSQEFIADGLGARFESKIDRSIVVSMGTGTSFVKCEGDDMRHIGGIGVGGGTLAGLSRIMLNTSDIKAVATMAKRGNIRNIDLTIGDISAIPVPGLTMDTTASNFARAQSDATKEDIAAGLIHMVLQSIGSAAWLASLGSDRLRAHRQPVAPAPVQRGVPRPGVTLQHPLPHPEVLPILHRHRRSPRLYISTKQIIILKQNNCNNEKDFIIRHSDGRHGRRFHQLQ